MLDKLCELSATDRESFLRALQARTRTLEKSLTWTAFIQWSAQKKIVSETSESSGAIKILFSDTTYALLRSSGYCAHAPAVIFAGPTVTAYEPFGWERIPHDVEQRLEASLSIKIGLD